MPELGYGFVPEKCFVMFSIFYQEYACFSLEWGNYPTAFSVTASFTLPQHRQNWFQPRVVLVYFVLYRPVLHHMMVLNVYGNVCGSRNQSAPVLVFYQFLFSFT